jgi:hypothetical protein
MPAGEAMATTERKMIGYTVTKNDKDLSEILEVQTANRPENLTQEELQREGFVSAHHDLEILRKMHEAYPHIIAKDGYRVVACALVVLRSFDDKLVLPHSCRFVSRN